MRKNTCTRSFQDCLSQFLTPQVWKQAHQAWQPEYSPPRWSLQPLIWVLLSMAWCCGDSHDERFATARAVYVAAHQQSRRPGSTLAGFLQALAKLPMPVLRTLARGVRQRLETQFVEALRLNGWLPLACDGSRLECPRSAELQRHLGEAGKTDSAPMMYLTALVLLPLGVLWSWRLGKGTASEHDHLRRLLPTLPERSLIVADACYLGYDLFQTILRARASFLVRLSSRAHLYTQQDVPLTQYHEGVVYYWPNEIRDANQPPIVGRMLRVVGGKADVWLFTNLLDREQLSHGTAAQVYRWRWKNEGLFRDYKRMLKKVKLQSRTVALVHREAEGSLLALQVLLAAAAVAVQRGRTTVLIMSSPRQMVLRLRSGMAALVRSLGPRQFAHYQRKLQEVRSQERPARISSKVRQPWPRRKPHKPPNPPKLRVMDEALKLKLATILDVA
jgi:hypothetical protein